MITDPGLEKTWRGQPILGKGGKKREEGRSSRNEIG